MKEYSWKTEYLKTIIFFLLILIYVASTAVLIKENFATILVTTILLKFYITSFVTKQQKKSNCFLETGKIILTALLIFTVWNYGLITNLNFYLFLYFAIIVLRNLLKKIVNNSIKKESSGKIENYERVREIGEILEKNRIKKIPIFVTKKGSYAAESGIFSKMIIINKNFIEESSREEFFFVIFHEIAHIKKVDFLKKEIIFYINRAVFLYGTYIISQHSSLNNKNSGMSLVIIFGFFTLQAISWLEKRIYKTMEKKSSQYGEELFNFQYKSGNERKNGI